MNEEERLSLNNYIEDLYQAMQIGDIIFDSNHSNELYNLINKLLKENQQLKEVIDKAREKIKLLGKFDGKTCTRGFQMWVADFNNLLEILNIDKGDEK